MGGLESGIQKDIVDAAVARYGKDIWIRVKHGTSYAVVGDSDIYGIVRGLPFVFEVKKPGEEPTKIQEYRMAEFRRAGGYACAVDSVKGAIGMLRRWLPGRIQE